MSMRILCRNLIWCTKPVTFRQKPSFRFKSVLPALEKNLEAKEQVDLQSLYSQFKNAEGFLNVCKQFNLDENILAKTIKCSPEVTNYDPSKITSNIEQFFQLGFEPNGITEIIQKYPIILDYEHNEIIDTFETWRSGNVHEKFLRKMFIEHPWLFSIDNTQVYNRLRRIHYLMNQKINRITSLLLISPTIMLGDWSEVEDKFQYILKEMRYLEKDISKSSALSQPMSLIKLRHIFLERVGVYIRPGLKDTAGMSPHINPPLARIVDPNDDEFAMNTAKVSPEEYRVFKKLMKREERANDNSNDFVDEKLDSEFDDVK